MSDAGQRSSWQGGVTLAVRDVQCRRVVSSVVMVAKLLCGLVQAVLFNDRAFYFKYFLASAAMNRLMGAGDL